MLLLLLLDLHFELYQNECTQRSAYVVRTLAVCCSGFFPAKGAIWRQHRSPSWSSLSRVRVFGTKMRQPASQPAPQNMHSQRRQLLGFFLNARLVSARWEKKSIEWARQTKRLKTSIMHSGAWCHWLEEKRVRAGRQKESFRVGLSSAKNSSSCGL